MECCRPEGRCSRIERLRAAGSGGPSARTFWIRWSRERLLAAELLCGRRLAMRRPARPLLLGWTAAPPEAAVAAAEREDEERIEAPPTPYKEGAAVGDAGTAGPKTSGEPPGEATCAEAGL